MEIPLSLRRRKDGALVYGIPLWYRIAMGLMLAVVAASVFSTGEAPGLGAWIVLALLALGLLYEERWTADPGSARLGHRAGILPFASSFALPFSEIADFRLEALARGTIPGTEDERKEKARAFALLERSGPGQAGLAPERLNFFKPTRMPYLSLIATAKDGQHYLIDSIPANRATRLVAAGRALAALCGVEFRETEKN